MTKYVNGSYQRASGTRDAFAGLSADLVSEGYPEIPVVSGDREPEAQEKIFRDKYVPSSGPKDVGPYNDRRLWSGHGYWKRVVGGGPVGAPGTSNHEKRRAADLGYPYNSVTVAHRRAQALASRHNITWEGQYFNEVEPWHWTYWGPLGTLTALSGEGASTPDIEQILEDAMANPIIDVNSTLWIGRNDGTFEQYETWKALNSRGIITTVFFGGKGNEDKIPKLSVADFEVAKTVWRQMCRGTAEAVWSHPVTAQTPDGVPVVPTRAFRADGYLASTNAIVNEQRRKS